MTAISSTLALPDLNRRTAVPRLFRLCVLETWYEFLKLLRQPHYIGGVVAFPIMFYVLFGLSFGRSNGGVMAARYLLASYSVFGVVTAALFAFGVGVSTERASGWTLLKQAAPLPAPVYLLAKVVTCMLFGGVIVSLLALLGVTAGGVRFSAGAWAGLFASVMFGCIPFCLFGLALGYSIPPAGAPGIVNLLNLPLAFAGGLWMPHEMLPRPIQAFAAFVPQHHLGRLALSALGLVDDPPLPHIAALAVATAVGFVCATLAYRRSAR